MEQRSHEHFYFEGGGVVPAPDRLRKVLVVGAGVAGLQVARQFLKLGIQVLVLELNDDVGGVWIRNYVNFGLQVPWRMYQFPEFPWPKDLQPSSEYPTGQEVQEYVRAYCREYNLRTYIRFNCKLLRLRWCPGTRQWDALYCDTVKEKFFKVTVDYAVICAGIYSQPYIPDYEGTDTYAGIQLHAKDFVDLSLARGRRVVIVGAGKTALDCVSSIVATNTATSVTLLYRQAHWPVPRRMLGTSVRRLLFNRAMTGMMPPYYKASRTQHLVDKATSPLKKLFWRSLESVISRKFRITEHMRPRVHLPADLFYGGQILDNTMDKLIRSDALLTIKGEINRFVRNGVILQDGNFVAADLVLYCTGYLKTYEYLEGDMRARLDLQKDGLYLYRNCLPYAVPHLAFIGSEVSTYNNILTHGLQALWLAHVLTGRVAAPSPAEMVEDVRAQQRWRRSIMPAQRSRGSVLMLYMMQYHDQLLADMGHRPHRKGFNFLAECFGTYTAFDYRTLMEEDDSETGYARQRAEEQLAAAGSPAAVLAATAGGRGGHMATAMPPPSGAGGASAPSGAPDFFAAAPHTSSNGMVNGASAAAGGGGAATAGAGAVRRYGTTHGTQTLMDERLYDSSRTGTSFSVRSVYHDSDSGCNNVVGGGGFSGISPGSGGTGKGHPSDFGTVSAGAVLATGAARGASRRVMPLAGGSPGRLSDVEAYATFSPEPPILLSHPPARLARLHSATSRDSWAPAAAPEASARPTTTTSEGRPKPAATSPCSSEHFSRTNRVLADFAAHRTSTARGLLGAPPSQHEPLSQASSSFRAAGTAAAAAANARASYSANSLGSSPGQILGSRGGSPGQGPPGPPNPLVVPSSPSRLCRHTGPGSPLPGFGGELRSQLPSPNGRPLPSPTGRSRAADAAPSLPRPPTWCTTSAVDLSSVVSPKPVGHGSEHASRGYTSRSAPVNAAAAAGCCLVSSGMLHSSIMDSGPGCGGGCGQHGYGHGRLGCEGQADCFSSEEVVGSGADLTDGPMRSGGTSSGRQGPCASSPDNDVDWPLRSTGRCKAPTEAAGGLDVRHRHLLSVDVDGAVGQVTGVVEEKEEGDAAAAAAAAAVEAEAVFSRADARSSGAVTGAEPDVCGGASSSTTTDGRAACRGSSAALSICGCPSRPVSQGRRADTVIAFAPISSSDRSHRLSSRSSHSSAESQMSAASGRSTAACDDATAAMSTLPSSKAASSVLQPVLPSAAKPLPVPLSLQPCIPPAIQAASPTTPSGVAAQHSGTEPPLAGSPTPGPSPGSADGSPSPSPSADDMPWRTSVRDSRGQVHMRSAAVGSGPDAGYGSPGSGVSLSCWNPGHHFDLSSDVAGAGGASSFAAAAAATAAPSPAGGGRGAKPRRSSLETSRGLLSRLEEEEEEEEDHGVAAAGGETSIRLDDEATEDSAGAERGARGEGVLGRPADWEDRGSSASGATAAGYFRSSRGPLMSAQVAAASSASTGPAGSSSIDSRRLATPAGPDGPLDSSSGWPQMLPGVGSAGFYSTGSGSGLLLNSNISLAAGIGGGSTAGGAAAGSAAIGQASGFWTELGPHHSPSRLSRSQALTDNVSCSLGNWVGHAAVALGPGGAGGSPCGVQGCSTTESRAGVAELSEDLVPESEAAAPTAWGMSERSVHVLDAEPEGRTRAVLSQPAAAAPVQSAGAAATTTAAAVAAQPKAAVTALADSSPFTSPESYTLSGVRC